uniref:Uncharacterized protein n=1 Tax=Panagrellus redivivus TaxID=6233 RepID=A0A7E4ZRS8_PANRE
MLKGSKARAPFSEQETAASRANKPLPTYLRATGTKELPTATQMFTKANRQPVSSRSQKRRSPIHVCMTRMETATPNLRLCNAHCEAKPCFGLRTASSDSAIIVSNPSSTIAPPTMRGKAV